MESAGRGAAIAWIPEIPADSGVSDAVTPRRGSIYAGSRVRTAILRCCVGPAEPGRSTRSASNATHARASTRAGYPAEAGCPACRSARFDPASRSESNIVPVDATGAAHAARPDSATGERAVQCQDVGTYRKLITGGIHIPGVALAAPRSSEIHTGRQRAGAQQGKDIDETGLSRRHEARLPAYYLSALTVGQAYGTVAGMAAVRPLRVYLVVPTGTGGNLGQEARSPVQMPDNANEPRRRRLSNGARLVALPQRKESRLK